MPQIDFSKYKTAPQAPQQPGGAIDFSKYKVSPADAPAAAAPSTGNRFLKGLGNFFSGNPTFPANTESTGVVGNTARTLGNVPSDVAGIVGTGVKNIAKIPGAFVSAMESAPNLVQGAKNIKAGYDDTIDKVAGSIISGAEGAVEDPAGTVKGIAADAINHPVSAALTFEGGGAAAGKDAIESTAGVAGNAAKTGVRAATDAAGPVVKAAKAVYDSAPSANLGAGKAASTASDILSPITQARLPGRIASLNRDITDMFSGAIKRSLGGTAKTIEAVQRLSKDIGTGVRTIVENKGLLKLTDEAGSDVGHALPKNMAEFGQSVQQVKSGLFKAYDSLAQAAGGAGARFDAQPLIGQMKAYIEDTAGKTESQVKAMQSRLDEVSRLHGQPFTKVQDYVGTLNGALSSVFKTGAEKETSDVLATITSELRSGMDSQIARTEGPGYALLRKQFGSVKSLEEMVAKAINRRVPEGLGNLVNVFSGEDMLLGALTLNPYEMLRGAALQGVKGYMRFLNSPDRAVAKMFDYVDGVYEKADQFGFPIREKPTAAPQLALPPGTPGASVDVPMNLPARAQSTVDATERARIAPQKAATDFVNSMSAPPGPPQLLQQNPIITPAPKQ